MSETIEQRLDRLERAVFPTQHPYPTIPWQQPSHPFTARGIICSACGLRFEGPTGYCCPRADCPTQPKATS